MKSASHFLMMARLCEITELEQIGRASEWVRLFSRLIHLLQKERGLANIVLASRGARGRTALAKHMHEVDAMVSTVMGSLDGVESHVPGGQGARLFNAMAYTLQGLESLPRMRAHVSACAITPEDSTAAYARLVAACLTVVFEAADSAGDPEVSRLLVAMFHFMQGKEFAGQERAMGAAVFGAGGCDAARQQQWLQLIDSQDRCFQVFEEFAPSQAAHRWQVLSQQSQDVALIERLRRVVCTAPAGVRLDDGLNDVWFAVCTNRLDAMHAVESDLSAELAQLCSRKLDAARDALACQPEALDAAGDDFFDTGAVVRHRDWPLAATQAAYGPQLERSILSLVQEQSQRLHAMEAEIEKTRTALKERKTIERAKGVLMHLRQIGESQAHQLMRQTAMNQNRRMLDVAEAVLSMAELMPAPHQ